MDSDDESFHDEDCGSEPIGDEITIPSEFIDMYREKDLEVLSTDEIFQYMTDFIEEVNNVTHIPHKIARILLTHHRWNKNILIDKFFGGDQDKFFSEARVVNPFFDDNSKGKSENSSGECQICFSVQPASHITGLECGHSFCTDCWCSYLTFKIMDEGVSLTLTCPSTFCKVLVDDASVMSFVTDSKVRQRHRDLIINTFVESNELLRWCPSPNCTYAIKVQCVLPEKVTCRCKQTFCSSCGENWHEPIKCAMLIEWIKKCDSEAETSHWIVTNTKDCPKCKATIEKAGGCNHIECNNCQANFCWVCLGPWEQHVASYYTCNKYDYHARKEQEKSRYDLNRFVFYSTRYKNHQNSLKLELQLYDTAEKKMAEMAEIQNHNYRWIDVGFIKGAVDTLCQCRQTLMYTYVIAYYLKKNNESIIFEDNQKDLERSTEKLSEYLEREISSENLKDIIATVKNMFVYCENRRRVLLNHMKELI